MSKRRRKIREQKLDPNSIRDLRKLSTKKPYVRVNGYNKTADFIKTGETDTHALYRGYLSEGEFNVNIITKQT